MEKILKAVDELPPEERQKAIATMLENSEDLNPAMRAKLVSEMVKNMSQMPTEEREKFLAGLSALQRTRFQAFSFSRSDQWSQ